MTIFGLLFSTGTSHTHASTYLKKEITLPLLPSHDDGGGKDGDEGAD